MLQLSKVGNWASEGCPFSVQPGTEAPLWPVGWQGAGEVTRTLQSRPVAQMPGKEETGWAASADRDRGVPWGGLSRLGPLSACAPV